MFYSTKIFEDVFLNKANSAIYVHGTKLCSNIEDYTLLKDYAILLNKNLQNNRNLEQKVSLNFCVDIQHRIKQYSYMSSGTYSRDYNTSNSVNVSIEISIVQKRSIKSLCIIVNAIAYHMSKIDIDAFLHQLQKFDGERKGNHSFIYKFGINGPNDEFLVSIGELYIKESTTDSLGAIHVS